MKTTNIILTTIISFLFIGCVKEENPKIIENLFFQPYDINKDYTLYNTIKTKNRENYIYENFELNTGVFPTITSGSFHAYRTVDDVYFLYNPLSENRFVSVTISNIDTSDFEISYDLLRTQYGNGHIKNAVFFWGSNDTYTSFNYYLENNSEDAPGTYIPGIQIGKVINSNYDYWEWHTLENSHSYNKFTIRKINNKYYFFINNTFIIQHNFNNFNGNKIGFVVDANSSIKIDNFKIDYIINLE